MLDDLKYLPPWEWPEDAKERLVAALGADDPEVRRTAAELAHHAMDDELAAVVLERATSADEDEEVRARAAIALGPSLEECDIEGFDHEISEPPLAEALFERIVTGLERLYREASAPKLVRRYALEAAVRAPRPWQTAAVRAAWASDDMEWRATAAFCMGWLRDLDGELGEALGASDPAILAAAVRGAAGGGRQLTPATERRLVEVLREAEDPDLIHDAIEALAGGETDAARELLEELSDSDDEETAELAAEALMMRGVGVPDDEDW